MVHRAAYTLVIPLQPLIIAPGEPASAQDKLDELNILRDAGTE